MATGEKDPETIIREFLASWPGRNVDRFRFGDKRVELPCAGVFEIRDGKIAVWRDYFDLATWQRQAG